MRTSLPVILVASTVSMFAVGCKPEGRLVRAQQVASPDGMYRAVLYGVAGDAGSKRVTTVLALERGPGPFEADAVRDEDVLYRGDGNDGGAAVDDAGILKMRVSWTDATDLEVEPAEGARSFTLKDQHGPIRVSYVSSR